MNVLELAREITPSLIKIRRQLHQYPEPGFQEKRTAGLIAKQLDKLKLNVKQGIAKTGVVALLTGAKRGKTIAIRADMDALPITEQTRLEFASKNQGIMHACGHDGNITCALGAAMILTRLKNQLHGQVKFIFQPAEEMPPGGASEMIAQGVLEDPKVDAIIALHVDPNVPTGKICVKPGIMMAAADDFKITVIGKGGHAALPHKSVDAIVVSSELVLALQTLASRKIDPLHPFVITIGTIQGGYRFNVIADKVEMTGTVRTFDSKTARMLPNMIKKIIKGITQSAGAKYRFEYHRGYQVLKNDATITELVKNAATNILGTTKVIELEQPFMGGEDFSYFSQHRPGTLFWLGVRDQQTNKIYPWHHPQFDIDENALPIGAAVFAQSVIDYLNR